MNRLAKETSPYLLQHRHNPVDWYPWGEEALAAAKRLDRPIFLSIGYSACHWCHVMERESFESPTIAKQMNERFVCIKVDREERPDLDEIYMAATQGLTGSGGWPMSVFMTPDLEPFFAGTYFPPEDRHGMPGFPRVLDHVHRLWTERREDVVAQSARVAKFLRESLAPVADPADPTLAIVDAAVAASAERFDEQHGGFGAPGTFAPKFPHASELSLLLRHHARTRDPKSLHIAELTLRRMAEGGMYDQLGGGFHRYSTDREWLVPHFEKMLYDNALLARSYAEAFLLTGDELWSRVLRETLDYLLREMQDPRGGFRSTQDADSEGVEGKFFVWDLAEVEKLCGDDARAFCLRYGVVEGGNWEHRSILHAATPIDRVAAELGMPVADVEARIARARATLFAARSRRVAPPLDDKILTAWNGMAIAACAIGHQVLGDERYLVAAQRAAAFVLTDLRADGRLLRTWRGGEARLMGYLEDYAFVADGLLALFETDFDPRWLRAARDLIGQIDEHFGDAADGSFFFTSDDHEELIARSKSVQESSQPSGIAMAAIAHLRGGLLLGDLAMFERGVAVLRAHHDFLERFPVACPSLVLAVDLALSDPREVVVAGGAEAAGARELVLRAWRTFPRNHVVVHVHDGNRTALEELTEVVAGKVPIDGAPAAYLCRRGVCDAPVTDPARLELSR